MSPRFNVKSDVLTFNVNVLSETQEDRRTEGGEDSVTAKSEAGVI